uniref:Aminotransferase-like plant mobile domain-containing protein n=1 Tax=Daucus carota subsp. sativus TaxID=79200 RepID=A0A166CZM5_DAUCS
MVGTFTLAQTNYHGYFNPADCPVERFKPWIRFLNEQCFASTAITADVELQLDPLRDYYSTLFNSTLVDNPRVTGTIRNKNIQITADDVNRILGFPRENFEEVPTKDELIQFFQTIQYQGVIKLSKMLKNKLVPEWDYFFNTMAKVFAPTTSKSFNNITSLLQIIGFCITHNRRINFGRMILITIIKRLGTFASRQLVVDNSVLCYYPRFLMLFLNDTMTAEDKAFYANSPTEQPHPPKDYYEDPEEEEVQFHMTRAESRRKPGEPFLLEEPITDEPPTPVHRNQEVEEGEVVRSDD